MRVSKTISALPSRTPHVFVATLALLLITIPAIAQQFDAKLYS